MHSAKWHTSRKNLARRVDVCLLMRLIHAMRPLALAVIALLAAGSIPESLALTTEKGKVIRGRYLVTGNARAIGFRSTFGPSYVRVAINGRLRGRVLRTQQFGGVVVQTYVKVGGKVRSVSIRARKGTFTAPAVIRLGKGAKFVGEFNGLTDQKTSRFFRGKVKGAKKSNLTLRSKK